MTTNAERFIRKYRNRKLYDKESHTYITLGEVLKMYQDGQKLKIVDFDERDITEETIIQSVVQTGIGDQKLRDTILKYARKEQTTAQV